MFSVDMHAIRRALSEIDDLNAKADTAIGGGVGVTLNSSYVTDHLPQQDRDVVTAFVLALLARQALEPIGVLTGLGVGYEDSDGAPLTTIPAIVKDWQRRYIEARKPANV